MLVDILNRYLRPYVKKLDPSQMKLGVWKGERSQYGIRVCGQFRVSPHLEHQYRAPQQHKICTTTQQCFSPVGRLKLGSGACGDCSNPPLS